MTLDEQKKVLDALAHNQWAADMMCFDAVCYGSEKSVSEFRDQREYAKAVIAAFPKDIREAYDAGLRKSEADKLRAQADAIERGAP